MSCSEISFTAPGECERNSVLVLSLSPMDLQRVEILRHQHELHHFLGVVAVPTTFWNSSIELCRPSMIALR